MSTMPGGARGVRWASGWRGGARWGLLAVVLGPGWAPGAEAATAVYYSVGTSVADLKSGAPTITISSGVATFSVAQPANVGVGDEITYNGSTRAYISARSSSTVYRVTTATGATPVNVSGATVNQVKRAFNLLSAAASGSSDVNHLNTSDLVAGSFQLNWACYNDAAMNDLATVSSTWITGPASYIRIFTPTAVSEVGVSQRHTGKAATGFRMAPVNAAAGGYSILYIQTGYVRVEGLEIDGSGLTGATALRGIFLMDGMSNVGDVRIDSSIIHDIHTTGAGTNYETTGAIFDFQQTANSGPPLRISNNIIYAVTSTVFADNHHISGIHIGSRTTSYVYNNTIYNIYNQGGGSPSGAARGIIAKGWPLATGTATVIATNNYVGDVRADWDPSFACYITEQNGVLTRSYDVSSDATVGACTGCQSNKSAYATYFVNTTAGSQDLHLKDNSLSAAIWGTSGVNLAGDPNLPVTRDIDGGLRVAPDVGADEFGLGCCGLDVAEAVGSTVTVTGPGQFEMVFRQVAGASLDSFWDLAEDPSRTYDLAGRPASEFHGLFHSSIVSGGLLYVTGANNNGPQLDLLEATATRARVRSATFYQRRPSSGSSAVLGGLKAIVDYSIYPSGKLGLHWNRRVTADVPYTDHPLEIAVHYEPLADPRGSLVGYSESGSTFPAPATDAFALAKFDAAGARTDFLAVMYQPWPAANQLEFSGSPSPYFFSWRDTDVTTLTAAANPSDSWNFLTYFKPTNLLSQADPAVTSRSADYRTPSAITLLKGSRWLDGTQNTGGADDYNEAEGAYVLGMDPLPGQGLQFRIDGTPANPRYQPFFKIRKWRSFVNTPTVTLDGISLAKDLDFKADVKPVSRSHWASTLSWHCTMESTTACNSGNLDVGVGTAGSTTGTTAVAGRYGNGLLFTANTDKVVAASSDYSPSIGEVEFWYQPRYASNDGLRYLLWYWQSGTGPFNCLAFEKTTGNTLLFWVRVGSTDNVCNIGGTTYTASVSVAAAFAWRAYDWVHLKTSWNSAGGLRKLRIAVNGVEAAISGTFVAPGGASTPSFGGCSGVSCPVNAPGNANGILDEVHIYGGLDLGGYDTNTPLAHAGLTSDAGEYLADTAKNWTLGLTPVQASGRGAYFYFGSDAPFLGLNVALQQPGVWSTTPGDLLWDYWDGTKWRSLESGFNFTDTTNQLTKSGTLYWDDPSTWTPYSVAGGPELYYVRVHLAAGLLTYATLPIERTIKTDILLFQYCGDITAAAREFYFAVPATTQVRLQSFSAVAGDSSALLEWRTASELDNLGFHLYRGLSADGPWTRLTESLIPGLGSSAVGQAYSYQDVGLQNGTRYFYRLVDVDASSKTTSHGPVSAVPAAGAAGGAPGSETPPSGGEREGSASSGCPAWVLAAYGSSVGSDASAATLRCTRHGDPEAVGLEVLSHDARQATLELRTGGFYALHEASGGVRVFVPGFDFPRDAHGAALPFRRALVDAVVGRRVQLGGVRALDEQVFRGLVPVTLGETEMELSWDGTVRAGRRARRKLERREVESRRVATELVTLLPSVFQGETKSAVVEIKPLRYDARRRQLVLARRVRVRLLFTGREPGERGQGRLGRREKPQPVVSGEVLARLYTRQRGLYAATFEQLFPGRNQAYAASELRLSRQGQAVGFHLEPKASSFGRGSVLYFFADTTAASTDYSSEVAYELRHARDGVVMPLVSAAPAGVALTSSPRGEATFETNRFYQPGLLEAEDPWLWQALVPGTVRRESFSLAGVDASSSQAAELDVYLQGASESGQPIDHHVSVSVNGVLAGEAQFAGKTPYRISLSVPGSLLHEGANELSLTSVADTGVSSLVFLDRFTVRYPQTALLASGLFEGSWNESGTATLSGTAGGVALVDLTAAPQWATDYSASGGALRFRAEAGHRYRAASGTALLSPRVAQPQPSGLRSAGNQADYILVAPRAFVSAADPLLARRSAQGLRSRGVAFEEIADEFGHGQPSAEAIRSFISYAYQSWAQPSPRYVVLLGDASYDPRHFMATSLAAPLPALWTKTSYLWTASDPLLAAVNGDDELPDLAIGRIPATTVEQAQMLVEKLIAWEDSGQGLKGHATLVADNPDLAGDFEANAREIAQSYLAGRSELLLLSQLGVETRPRILDALNGGLSYLDYVGHGGSAVWASENVWNSWDAASLLAQSEQPLLLTLNCLNGYFVAPSYDSLSESLLKAEGRGAIAAFSPSGLSLDAPAHQYHRALMGELVSGRHERLGDALLAAQQGYAQTGLMPELISVYHLLGDPATPIR